MRPHALDNARLNPTPERSPPILKALPEDNQPPPLLVPVSPLAALLATMTLQQRRAFTGITLSPRLGYNKAFRFVDGQHLYRWLKPVDGAIIQEVLWRAEMFRIKTFRKTVTPQMLASHCRSVNWSIIQCKQNKRVLMADMC